MAYAAILGLPHIRYSHAFRSNLLNLPQVRTCVNSLLRTANVRETEEGELRNRRRALRFRNFPINFLSDSVCAAADGCGVVGRGSSPLPFASPPSRTPPMRAGRDAMPPPHPLPCSLHPSILAPVLCASGAVSHIDTGRRTWDGRRVRGGGDDSIFFWNRNQNWNHSHSAVKLSLELVPVPES